MKYELANAIAELNEAYEFFEEIVELSPEEMVEREVIDAYFQSELHKKFHAKTKFKSEIERILKDADFSVIRQKYQFCLAPNLGLF